MGWVVWWCLCSFVGSLKVLCCVWGWFVMGGLKGMVRLCVRMSLCIGRSFLCVVVCIVVFLLCLWVGVGSRLW